MAEKKKNKKGLVVAVLGIVSAVLVTLGLIKKREEK